MTMSQINVCERESILVFKCVKTKKVKVFLFFVMEQKEKQTLSFHCMTMNYWKIGGLNGHGKFAKHSTSPTYFCQNDDRAFLANIYRC